MPDAARDALLERAKAIGQRHPPQQTSIRNRRYRSSRFQGGKIMQKTAPDPFARTETTPAQRPEKATMDRWSTAERDRILAEHPELKDDNWGFIRELLRRRGVKC
jgi:hypothetical protein